MMRALVKNGSLQADTRVQDVAVPVPRAGQLVLRVEGCGLCGSDVHAWRGDDGYGWVTTPVVMGHEVVGRVASVGDSVAASLIGERGVPLSILGCGSCEICATEDGPLCPERRVIGLSGDGGAAEYVICDAGEFILVPQEMPFERAALTEPLSVAVHAIERFPDLSAGDRVGVCGPGPVGLLAAWALKQRGIDCFIVGIERDRETRLLAAERLGIETFVVGSQDVPQARYWVEASGSAAGLSMTLDRTLPGGQVTIVALFGSRPTFDINVVVRRQIRMFGSYASVRADYDTAVELLAASDGTLEDALVSVIPLADAVEALAATSEGRLVKAVLAP